MTEKHLLYFLTSLPLFLELAGAFCCLQKPSDPNIF